MTIFYPAELPKGLYSGRTYQVVSPLQRSDLSSGRARQRRRFTSVPESATVSWLFNDSESQLFEVWWRDQLTDGASWFECPLDTPLGMQDYTCRFTDVYSGPTRVGPNLWKFDANLELRERAVLTDDWSILPGFLLNKEIFDYAMNQEWPANIWQSFIHVADLAINEDWPQP